MEYPNWKHCQNLESRRRDRRNLKNLAVMCIGKKASALARNTSKNLDPERLGDTHHISCQIINKGGARNLKGPGHAFNDGVVAHAPEETTGCPTHTNATEDQMMNSITDNRGGDTLANHRGQESSLEPEQQLPTTQDLPNPMKGQALEGLVLVPKKPQERQRDPRHAE